MKTKISVIMGIYNCESTLSESLDSIINQTYKNFKIILCDDASTDNTYDIALSYASRYPRSITLLRNNINLGLAATLNKCLSHVDTEFIARMDGDDISLPDRFHTQLKFLENNKSYAFVSCPMIYFDKLRHWIIPGVVEEPTRWDFKLNTPFCHAPALIRTSSILKIGGYDSNIKRSEDYDLWVRFYANGFRGYNLSSIHYMMRDDYKAYKRRTFKSRLEESYIRYKSFIKLNYPWYMYIYVLRPLLIGLLPYKIYSYLRNKKRKLIQLK